MSRSKPVVFERQSFPSVKALMTHLGISKSAYYLRQFRGLAPDAVPPPLERLFQTGARRS